MHVAHLRLASVVLVGSLLVSPVYAQSNCPPGFTCIPIPEPPVAPAPLASVDLTMIYNELANFDRRLSDLEASLTAARAENQKYFADASKSPWATIGPFVLKYVLPAVGAALAGYKVAK